MIYVLVNNMQISGERGQLKRTEGYVEVRHTGRCFTFRRPVPSD